MSPQFTSKVSVIAASLGIDPAWLLACMRFESGLDPSKRNHVSGATGLIQFMPSTAIGLGTTVDALAAMSAEDQLDWVEKYFSPYRGRLHTFADTYMAILWPAAVGEPDEFVLFRAGTFAYEENRALDVGIKGYVTKADAASFPAKYLTATEQAPTPAPVPTPTTGTTMGALAPIFLQTILPSIIGLFAPKVQQQISKATGASPDIANAFLQNLMAAVSNAAPQPVTDQATAIQAVAAVSADPAKIAEVQAHALDYLDKLGPMFDKLAAAEAASSAASIAGMNAASARAQADKWDMTPWLVWFAGGTATLLVLSLGAAIIYQSVTGSGDINTGLIGIAGPLLAIAMSVWREVFSYRFDGSKNSETQTALATAINNASNRATVNHE